MNGKVSVAALAGVGVVAVLVGLLIGTLGLGPPSGSKAAKQKEVLIQLTSPVTSQRTCQQTVGGISDALTNLRKPAFLFAGDSVHWSAADSHGSAQFVLQFPEQTPDRRVGTPFVDSKGNPKFTFSTGDSYSGPPSASAAGDYYYESVKIGTTDCGNPADPGVHVDP